MIRRALPRTVWHFGTAYIQYLCFKISTYLLRIQKRGRTPPRQNNLVQLTTRPENRNSLLSAANQLTRAATLTVSAILLKEVPRGIKILCYKMNI